MFIIINDMSDTSLTNNIIYVSLFVMEPATYLTSLHFDCTQNKTKKLYIVALSHISILIGYHLCYHKV